MASDSYIDMGEYMVGYSRKAGSQLICGFFATIERREIAIFRKPLEALRLRAEKPLWLIVRQPLERLVSAWHYFTGPYGSLERRRREFRGDSALVSRLIHPSPFEDWYEDSRKLMNRHWQDQKSLHTVNGVFLPTHLLPLEALEFLGRKNATEHTHYLDYYTREFRQRVEEDYAQDMVLHEQAMTDWDGTQPEIFTHR